MHRQLGQMERAEKRCQNTMQEVQVLSERLEIEKGTVEGKLRQSRATEEYCDQIFLRRERSWKKRNQKKLCVACTEKHDLWRCQNDRDEARRLRRSRSSRRTKKEADSQNLVSFESCRSSAVDHVEEMRPKFPRNDAGRARGDE